MSEAVSEELLAVLRRVIATHAGLLQTARDEADRLDARLQELRTAEALLTGARPAATSKREKRASPRGRGGPGGLSGLSLGDAAERALLDGGGRGGPGDLSGLSLGDAAERALLDGGNRPLPLREIFREVMRRGYDGSVSESAAESSLRTAMKHGARFARVAAPPGCVETFRYLVREGPARAAEAPAEAVAGGA